MNLVPRRLRLSLARDLRKNLTDAENAVWNMVRARRIRGTKFARQVPIGDYIVDFCCFERTLVIEVDGGQHDANRALDAVRTEFLKTEGFDVVRFWNNEVLNNPEAVYEVIDGRLSSRPKTLRAMSPFR
jgi:very-short-patch-repair endonuclease